MSMPELDEQGLEELYFLLACNETSLPPRLYSLKVSLEKSVLSGYSFREIMALKSDAERRYGIK